MSRPSKVFAPIRGFEDLALDRKHIVWSCDALNNPAFRKADANTRDIYGRRIADEVFSRADVEREAAVVREILEKLFAGEQVELDPVRLSSFRKANGGWRTIAIPTYRRRCISNAIGYWLAKLTASRLPKSVHAFIPGMRDPHYKMARDIGLAVAKGHVVHYVVLDFSNYFPSMSWVGTERALTHYGFDPACVQAVMQLVRTSCVEIGRRGQWHIVERDQGTLQGLPESAVLANLFPYEVDETFEGKVPHLLYARYADDVFLGAQERGDVVGAAREVRRWTQKHGLGIKGLSPDEGIR